MLTSNLRSTALACTLSLAALACGDDATDTDRLDGPAATNPTARARALIEEMYAASASGTCAFLHGCSSPEERAAVSELFMELGVPGGIGADARSCTAGFRDFFMASVGEGVLCESTARRILALEPAAQRCTAALRSVSASCESTFEEVSARSEAALDGPECQPFLSGLEALGEEPCGSGAGDDGAPDEG